MSDTERRKWRGGSIALGRTEAAPAVRIVTSERAPVAATVSTTFAKGQT